MFGWLGKAKEPETDVEEAFDPVERRVAERHDIYADAVAMSTGGRVLKKGIALDLSANGTRVRFENGDSLIDGMVVNIARHGIKRRGRMRWRTRTDVGVEFIDDAE